jgi:hypothetical protein
MSLIAARVFILVLVAFILVTPSSYAADTQATEPHVRTSESIITGLIRMGIAESSSFRALVSRLDASDVVVYVKFERQLSAQLEGQLTFVGGGGGRRYVVVSLAWGRPDLRAIATLGHELQHAVEVADHPEIIDSDTLADGYEVFGQETRRLAAVRSYETSAAIDAGHRIWKELCRRGE